VIAPPAAGAVAGPRILVIVAARNETDRIADTVAGLGTLVGEGRVVVVDDGSTDATAAVAASAGARVLIAPRPLGKGAALEGALERLPLADVYLLADGDLGASSAELLPVLEAVLDDRADLAVAVPPPPPVGGFGLVKRLAQVLVAMSSGFRPGEPLSGQRALTRDVLESCRPLAPGFGIETGMTTDAARMGFRVLEVPAPVEHRFLGRDVAGFLHRGRQGIDVLRAALPRVLGVR
jgi:glycosyltransferase involved in cell wall biosynthesis